MKKIIVAAPQESRDDILNLLQSKGTVELIDVNDSKDTTSIKNYRNFSTVEDDNNRIKFTYEFLKKYSSAKKTMFNKKEVINRQEFDELEKRIDWQTIYSEAVNLDNAMSANRSKASRAQALIEQYRQWDNLDIRDEELKGLKKVSYFIGSVSKRNNQQLYDELTSDFKDVYIQKISEKKEDINLFILCHINDGSKVWSILKKYGFAKIKLDLYLTPANRIKQLNEELITLNKEFDELTKNAVKLSENISDIEKAVDFITNKLDMEKSISRLAKTKKTFVLQGWIPEDKVENIKKALEKFKDIYIDFEDAAEEDTPPIVLKNNAFIEPFEIITTMYAVPLYTEVDPTPVLAPFYLIFFGMMAADIGYGLVMLTITLLALRFMDLEGQTKKMVKLLAYVSIPTIIFGWVFGGFFGDAIYVKPLWVNPVDKPMDVLYVSLALGIVHLFTGLGVKAYWFIKNGKIMDAVYDVLFWYLLLTGLLWLLLSSTLGGGLVAKYMAIIGAVGLFLTQGRENKSIAGKIFGGIYGLYGITSYIGDILSYSRLLALGLSTSLIGSSFNLLINLLGGGITAYIAGPIIFIAGHTFNLLIGMLGTFVHACRLEYLEFFGKFYEGGGRAFNPLKINTKFIKVNTQE